MYLFIDLSVDDECWTHDMLKKKKIVISNGNINEKIAYGLYFNNTIFNIADPSPIIKIDRRW